MIAEKWSALSSYFEPSIEAMPLLAMDLTRTLL